MPTYNYNKEYSCTIHMSLHHLVGKLQDDFKLIIQACVFRVEAVRLLVNKFRETGSILDKKRNVKRCVLTQQKLEEIGERLGNSHQKSLLM